MKAASMGGHVQTGRFPSLPGAIKKPAMGNSIVESPSSSEAGEVRVNWADIKDVAGVGLGASVLGATPVLGASLGFFELAANFSFGKSLPSIVRGATVVALNAFGTVSLLTGFLPGAAIGLGGSAALVGGGFAVANSQGKSLTTTEPVPKKTEPVKEKKPFSFTRAARAALTGVTTAAFTALPGMGLLVGLNAADHDSNKEGAAFASATWLSSLVRVGAAAVSVGTLNPLPYLAAVGLNSAISGASCAADEYQRA